MSKEPFSDKRWTEWPTQGIKTGGKPKEKVHKMLQQWLKDHTNKSGGNDNEQ